jgi:hypothetical protein
MNQRPVPVKSPKEIWLDAKAKALTEIPPTTFDPNPIYAFSPPELLKLMKALLPLESMTENRRVGVPPTPTLPLNVPVVAVKPAARVNAPALLIFARSPAEPLLLLTSNRLPVWEAAAFINIGTLATPSLATESGPKSFSKIVGISFTHSLYSRRH